MAATSPAPPLKRSSPPPANPPARAFKLPRLAATTTPIQTSLPPARLMPEPTSRTPKLASLFKKPHERDPAPMRNVEASFVDTHFDVEDAAIYQDALLILEGISNRLNHLTRHQVRLLLCIALFPQLFKPPEQHGMTHFSSRSTSTPSSAPSRTALLVTSPDPLAPTHRRLRELACALLADALDAQGGAELVGDAVVGYGMPSRADAGSSLSAAAGAALDSDDEGDYPARKKLKAAKGKGKARAAAGPDVEDPHDGDDVLSLAANRILSDATDLWDVLGGTTARRERVRSARSPVLEIGGWDLVAVLVAAWDKEAERKAAAARAQGVDLPEPLSLLRQFKPSASTSAARQLSPKALDVVFWPFVHGSASDDEEDEDEDGSDEKGSASEGGSAKGRREVKGSDGRAARERAARERAEADGTSLEVKRQVAVRLLKLIGDSAVQGYLDGEPTVSDLVQRMKALAQDDFVALVEHLADISTAQVFTTRLLTAYLETHSHPPSAVVQLHPSFAPSTLASTADPSHPLSPRKLSATTSLSKLNHSSASIPTATAHSAYWRIPSIAQPAQLFDLAQRVPRDVPLRGGRGGAGASASASADKGKGPAGLSRRAQLEVARFEVVKEAVVGLVVGQARRDVVGEDGERERGDEERAEVLRQVREAVERVEKLVRVAGGTDV
ncbi:hypothetical protein JCM3775_002825 [Rhodotorula graminis]